MPSFRRGDRPQSQFRAPAVIVLIAVLMSGVAAPAQGGAARPVESAAAVVGSQLPSGFEETVAYSGLTQPTAIRFASDGRVVVAEKSGVIKIYDSLSDTVPTVYSDLVPKVHDYWDRGLLGLALDPTLTGQQGTPNPYIYVGYTYDHVLGSTAPAPRWGDSCPTPPGPTTDGCVVSGRVSRLPLNGTTISGPEQVLIEDWCQQFPSHSVGSLAFGADGALYVSGGDGAGFQGLDYGQRGGSLAGTPTPKNPCGDPPGGAMTPPSAAGGALRSQDLRCCGTSAAYPALVVGDGAVAYWRLGETSGTTAFDASGNANHGTYVGGPGLGAGGALVADPDRAVTFDGSNDHITVPDSVSLDLGDGPLSYELWYRRDGVSASGGLVHKGSGAQRLDVGFDGKLHWYTIGSGVAATGSGPDDADVWHHLVATKTATDVWRVYIDGVDVTTVLGSPSTINNTKPLEIGRGPSLAYFEGELDEVAIYKVALTPTQISAHHAAGRP